VVAVCRLHSPSQELMSSLPSGLAFVDIDYICLNVFLGYKYANPEGRLHTIINIKIGIESEKLQNAEKQQRVYLVKWNRWYRIFKITKRRIKDFRVAKSGVYLVKWNRWYRIFKITKRRIKDFRVAKSEAKFANNFR